VYTVKYYVDDQLKGSLDVSYGNPADISTYVPTLEEGYIFDGWYKDSEKTQIY
jgi:hypothetical protein